MLSQSDQQNPKLTPFKLDPSKYLEKFVTLLSLINDVESNTNLAELKTEYEKTKSQLEKARSEKQKFFSELSQVTIQYHELEKEHQKVSTDNKSERDQFIKEREQLESIIMMSKDQVMQLQDANQSLALKVTDLSKQLEIDSNKKFTLVDNPPGLGTTP